MDQSSGANNDVAPTEAEIAEQKEWDSVANDLFPGLSDTTTTTTVETTQAPETTTTTTVAVDETTTTTTTVAPDTTTTTTTIDPNETPEQKAAREAAEVTTTTTTVDEAVSDPDHEARNTREAQRRSQAQVDAIAKDVREKMFKDAPTVLSDADGDPIRGIEDVMKLVNPITGEAFTQEEAGIWLLSAQQKFNQGLAEMDKRIDGITETLVDLKDQADSITYKYGELLKSDEPLRKKLWAQYEKTLVKDEKSGIYTAAPVNMVEFYEVALEPYARLAKSMEDQKAGTAAADAEAAKVAKEAADKAEADKLRTRQDRSDIFGRGNVDEMTDPEDKEWAEAANVVFGPKKK